jgi:hypothetical protein
MSCIGDRCESALNTQPKERQRTMKKTSASTFVGLMLSLSAGVASAAPDTAPSGDALACSAVTVPKGAGSPDQQVTRLGSSQDGRGVTPSFDSCTTYYGTCTGFWPGWSCAYGEGYSYCEFGATKYAFMTVCDGNVTSAGYGVCLW